MAGRDRSTLRIARHVVLAALAGALAIAGTSALGFWQLRRAADKEILQREVEASARAAPIVPTAASLSHAERLIHKHLRLRGHWLPDRVIYLDNRPQRGRAGFYVLMPLRIDAPLAADVIVNRGWLPRDFDVRTRIAPYDTPKGEVTITGVALANEPRLLELSAQAERKLGGIWQNFDFDAYARANGSMPLRMVVRQDPPRASSPSPTLADAAPGDDGLDRDWPDRGGELQSQIDRHYGYAFQWFALAASLLALLIFQIVRLTKHARKQPA